MGVESKVFFST